MQELEKIVGEWLALPDVAELLNLQLRKVHGLLSDHQIVEARVGENNIRAVPAAFIQDGEVVDSLPGTISVLLDSGFQDDEIIRWLFTPDESLPGTPIEALRQGRKTEIRRRAQAMAW
ncbi:hypothetical protein HD598_002429 [Neomicrococcus aestuarii]|uniref:DNA-binding protein n=1 Tax=Neomicrococcus aestuarii TaxID=556325 RepID=A0A7W8X0Z9_9MICC|nr:Rv2175c family DNA-binding protein [Neomicrococcus aestuarii]MBB5513742.1 hypothetical protein [Neomicrococcus aestuarii]